MKYGLSIGEQLSDFLFAVGFGFVLAVLYYTIVFVRKLIAPKSKKAAFVVSDIFFTFCAALLFFVFAQVFCNGQLRIDTAVGCALGFFAFSKTLSKPLGIFADAATKAVRKFFDVLFFPAKALFKSVKKTAEKIKKKRAKKDKIKVKKTNITFGKNKGEKQKTKKRKRRMKKSQNALEK